MHILVLVNQGIFIEGAQVTLTNILISSLHRNLLFYGCSMGLGAGGMSLAVHGELGWRHPLGHHEAA